VGFEARNVLLRGRGCDVGVVNEARVVSVVYLTDDCFLREGYTVGNKTNK
jgi:hypothetical protein